MSGAIILNCIVCGALVQDGEEKCSNCRSIENQVKVLSLEEKQRFDGITLEQDSKEQGHYEYEKNNTNHKIYSKQISLNGTSLFTKIMIGIIVAVMLVIALPIALFVMSIVGLFLYVMRR